MTSDLTNPSDTSSIASSLSWINDVLFNQIAISLCIVAVALIGFLMLTGRLPLRRGMQVALGCFVLLGAPVIASAFISGARDMREPLPPPPIATEENPRGDLPPADYSPYGQASVRDDGQ